MKATRSIHPLRRWAFTLIELLVVIAIIAILAGFALPAFTRAQKKGRITDSVNNVKQITLSLRMYADDNQGSYPSLDTAGAVYATSNPCFAEALIPAYLANKGVFVNKASAWCKPANPDAVATDAVLLKARQNDYFYVTNLNTGTSDPRWPLAGTAPEAAAITYSKSASVKGGVWAGTDAVVGLCDGSVRSFSGAEMNITGASTFIKHPSLPTANMLDGLATPDWFAPALSGVLTLLPL